MSRSIKYQTNDPGSGGFLPLIWLLALTMIFPIHILTAQVVLDSDNTPHAESEYYFATALLAGKEIRQAGSGVTWDLSGIVPLAETVMDYYTSDPEYNAFPEHDYPDDYFDSSLFNLKSYQKLYKVTEDRFSLGYLLMPVLYAGYQAVGADITLLEFPFGFSDSFSEEWPGGWMNKASRTVTADAYGTLILPYSTHLNTLRVHTYEKIDYAPVPSPHATYDTLFRNTYDWYDGDSEVPVFSATFSEFHSWDEGWIYKTYDTLILIFIMRINTESAISKPKPDNIVVFPIPSVKELTIRSISPEAYKLDLVITDIQGNSIYVENDFILLPGDNKLSLGTDLIASGVYILDLISGKNSRVSKKFIVR